MEISTKYDINQDVFYLEHECALVPCATCEGKKIINVTNGVSCWNIKCPDCKGKGSSSRIVHIEVVSGTIKEIIARRASHKKAFTQYGLHNGKVKKEDVIFTDAEEAEKQCYIMNETIKRDKKATEAV